MKKEMDKSYTPANHEDRIYELWEKAGCFNPDNFLGAENAQSYSIVMPPPNVTGTLHMGHASMLALEDILIRYAKLKGQRTVWIPGTDHAAIATQTKVEKNLKAEGLSRHDLGREKFLERVKEFAQASHDTIVNQVRKMGCACDWSREAYTLDATRHRAVNLVFKMMFDDGLIYRGDRVVNWCPRCHSTLADDEVEYKNQTAKFYTFKYDANFPIAISTTRPETKLGDTAIAVNPQDKRYEAYIGQTLTANFCGQKLNIKIIADRNVDMNFGTGALGVTPAHSLIDWQMAQANNLEIIKVIDEDGKIKSGFGKFSGLEATVARQLIVTELQTQNLISQEEEIANNLSICYRCGSPIEPLPSLQWFIDVNKKIPRLGQSIKELSVAAVKTGVFGKQPIKIVPERFNKSYFNWMENLHDWCISRQIWFGHRVPVWYRETEIYVGEQAPSGEGWIQDQDTLDTWFSSGIWTFTTLAKSPEDFAIENGKLVVNSEDYKKFHPTSVLETGYDIIFFWVARMILMTTYALEDIPFQDVYLHGLIRDEHGKKMSKSLGNIIDPLDMIAKYGADAARLSLVIGSTPGNDTKLSEEKISSYRNFTNKLWNIARFVITTYGVNHEAYEQEKLTEADRWIINKLNKLIAEVTADLDNYQFSPAGEKLRDFTWNDLADWYLEVAKFEKDDNKTKILSHLLTAILKLWHPFIPFITEAIWENLNIPEKLIDSRWPQALPLEKTANNFNLIKNIITGIRDARSVNKVEPAKKIKAVIYAPSNLEFIESQTHLLKGLRTGLEEITIDPTGEKITEAIFVPLNDLEIYLLGAVDAAKEQARLAKEQANLEKVIQNLEAKLGNQEFVAKAPANIVKIEQEKLANYKQELAKIQGA